MSIKIAMEAETMSELADDIQELLARLQSLWIPTQRQVVEAGPEILPQVEKVAAPFVPEPPAESPAAPAPTPEPSPAPAATEQVVPKKRGRPTKAKAEEASTGVATASTPPAAVPPPSSEVAAPSAPTPASAPAAPETKETATLKCPERDQLIKALCNLRDKYIKEVGQDKAKEKMAVLLSSHGGKDTLTSVPAKNHPELYAEALAAMKA